MMIGFFKTAFNRYDFLIDEIIKNFENFQPAEKAKIVLLLRVLNKKSIPLSKLSSNEIKYKQSLDKAVIPNPYEQWDRVLAPAQMDMLWGDFYATGAYKPIRRIMNLLMNEKEGKIAQEMIAQKRRPQTKKEINQFTMGMLHILAVKSLIRNADICDRADQYCIWAIENNDLPEESMSVIKPLFENEPQEQSQFKKMFDGKKLY
jgi:hypothetical protein